MIDDADKSTNKIEFEKQENNNINTDKFNIIKKTKKIEYKIKC